MISTKWLDPYEFRAGFVPTIIVFSPLGILYIITWPDHFVSLNLVSSETFFLIGIVIIIYALSFLIRHCGKKIESNLWTKWGGAPSTRFLRWSDPTFETDTKERIHEILKKEFKISLLSKKDEKKYPLKGDKLISSAFLRVKAFLYYNDSEGIWKKHNMEYGFNRNLMGSRWIWLIFSIIGTIVFVYLWIADGSNSFLVLGVILSLIELICSIVVGWYYLPLFVKEAADRYSESAWMAFLAILDKNYQ